VPSGFENCHSFDAHFVQGILYRVELGDLNNRFNLSHRVFALNPSGIITVAGTRAFRKLKVFMLGIGKAYEAATSFEPRATSEQTSGRFMQAPRAD
jgi:hypothetical protein